MVQTVRDGQSIRSVALRFGLSRRAVHFWVKPCQGQRLDRCDFSDRPARPRWAHNRGSEDMERRVLGLRQRLRAHSARGEYGAAAIARALQTSGAKSLPAVST